MYTKLTTIKVKNQRVRVDTIVTVEHDGHSIEIIIYIDFINQYKYWKTGIRINHHTHIYANNIPIFNNLLNIIY